MAKPKPAVLIARNNLHLTRKAIETLQAQDIPGGVEILVADNASTDGTAQYLNSLDGVVTMHVHPQRSVAEVWNTLIGIYLDAYEEPYVLVINNDVELRPDTYRLLVESKHLFATAVGVNSRHQMEGPVKLEDRPHPDFSCFLIRRECWQKVGKFDERYRVAFAEDCDYHVRMHRNGVMAMCIGVPFYHVGSATVKQSNDLERAAIMEQAEANRELFFQTYGSRIGSPAYESLFTEASFGQYEKREY